MFQSIWTGPHALLAEVPGIKDDKMIDEGNEVANYWMTRQEKAHRHLALIHAGSTLHLVWLHKKRSRCCIKIVNHGNGRKSGAKIDS